MKLPSACRSLLACATAAILFISAVHPVLGQTSGNGNINGTVTDSSGAAVPNASVTVIDSDTGVTRSLTTNADGSYSANFLQPGHYEIVFAGTGLVMLFG